VVRADGRSVGCVDALERRWRHTRTRVGGVLKLPLTECGSLPSTPRRAAGGEQRTLGGVPVRYCPARRRVRRKSRLGVDSTGLTASLPHCLCLTAYYLTTSLPLAGSTGEEWFGWSVAPESERDSTFIQW
jgi:hypothetical protein